MDPYQFEDLIDTLKAKALDGDVQAMRHLGDAYYQGASGKDRNITAALPYWQQAADCGDISVAYKVGCAIYNGEGCAANAAAAIPYFKMAADAGNRDAQFSMGLSHMKGIGCVKNTAVAKKYFEMAALQGDTSAQWYLGSLQFMDKEDDWLHWVCCAHIGNINQATEFLNHMIDNGTSRDVLDYQIELIEKYGIDPQNSRSARSANSSGGGCYIATCVYGSYDCPQVWTLRRFRDNTLASTWYGRAFIRTYYAVSPALVKWFGHTAWFKQLWRGKLDVLVEKLQAKGIAATPYSDAPR